MSQRFEMRDFLARSTDAEFDETPLAKALAGLPSISASGPWIAGGAVRRTVSRNDTISDFDFFFKDADQLIAFAESVKARGFLQVKETEHHQHWRGRVDGIPQDIDVQLIRFAFYFSAEHVIDSFDFTICQFAFDGTALIAGDYALWDLGRKRLAVHKITYPVSSMRRVLKYAQQGFYACGGCLSTLLAATANNPALDLNTQYVD